MRRGAEEEHEWLLARVLEVAPGPPSAMRTSASWDEKMQHRVVLTSPPDPAPARLGGGGVGRAEATGSRPSLDAAAAAAAATTSSQGAPPAGKGGAPSAKERRRLFKKSGSLDSSSVGTCIARAGVTTLLPPALPSAFSPADFLATIRGKLAPAFGRWGEYYFIILFVEVLKFLFVSLLNV